MRAFQRSAYQDDAFQIRQWKPQPQPPATWTDQTNSNDQWTDKPYQPGNTPGAS